MAMATARVEKHHVICAFDDTFSVLPITEKTALPDVMRIISNRPHGRTDSALPMVEALRRGWNAIEGFAIYTDNETWFGSIHPKQALQQYRDQTGVDARLVSVSMLANDTSIADGSVPWMLDFVGMSTDTPRQVSMYLKCEI